MNDTGKLAMTSTDNPGMGDPRMGASVPNQALVASDQAAARLDPTGLDPSREALRRIAFLRPAGDVYGIRLKDAQRLIETIERIALDALGEGL
jgi:hypothetical protein